MLKISYPSYDHRIKEGDEKEWIFDPLRKKWVRLTPEEWVRQNFIQYLLLVKQYPASLIAIEKEIQVGELRKRFDILVYKESKPWMIIECKEMDVTLTQAIIAQILSYQTALQASYLIISNGTEAYGFDVRGGSVKELEELPGFDL